MELIAEHRRRCDQCQPFIKPIHLTSVNSFSLYQAEHHPNGCSPYVQRFLLLVTALIDLRDCPLIL
ncbi:hypothetical protein T02_12614 [Trichinella nativa]|uniref:Uncharacterized protein n=2 Tax=Trichinella TaxID=6333 RepID=A0A0V1LE82_9BILA|nr:hypothetical protein T12_8819 [Trichinella patagoniensis]KRZ57374.1 hypothetical protein T02_12614 [Trichinella nativa]KRZ94409.1 hypothetical protein T08_10328 [Trichinella sp. T8]